MLVERPKSKIVSKIIRSNDGKLLRAFFLVTEYQGKYYVKLLKTETLDNTLGNEKRLLLDGERISTSFEFFDKIGERIVSPYQDFNFFTSQLTRAPSGSF